MYEYYHYSSKENMAFQMYTLEILDIINRDPNHRTDNFLKYTISITMLLVLAQFFTFIITIVPSRLEGSWKKIQKKHTHKLRK